MIDRTHDLSIAKQAKVLGISRGSVYYLPRPVPAADLAIMRRMDELHLEFPFAGSRMLRDLLSQEGIDIGRRHVSTLMKRMGIEALYRKPNTSKPTPRAQDLPVSAARDVGLGVLGAAAVGAAAAAPYYGYGYDPGLRQQQVVDAWGNAQWAYVRVC